MKIKNFNYITIIVCTVLQGLLFSSCNDFLDREPLARLSPSQYLTSEASVASYATNLYETFPVHPATGSGYFVDSSTDNMTPSTPNNMYATGYWRVDQAGGTWEFSQIYRCNYFFENVLPLIENNRITGNMDNINHYVGEVYFFRAYNYFNKLMALGDFPIVDTTLPDDLETLTEASKRAPRNEVARFILSDLDRALEYMKDDPPGGTNRLSKDCARLFKSRVALFEATFLKYFMGTAFVPNGTDWPGKQKDYNSNYSYPAGSIDAEIDYFLTQAMNESKIVADKYSLVENTGIFQNLPTDEPNPYFDMFGAVNMNPYEEILLWKRYDAALGVSNGVSRYANMPNGNNGTTKSMLDAFIMKDGKPIYSASLKDENDENSYWGDDDLLTITKNRDSRAVIFFKKPGELNVHTEFVGQYGVRVEPYPSITTSGEGRYTTGYALRKGLNFDGSMNEGWYAGYTGCIIFRAVEAYLNYMEACYEKTGAIDATADSYWKTIRRRAHVSEDYALTIGLTNMNKESETDWGAWSGGQLVDATLFNIRRERRCELMQETYAYRRMDVRRWRAMDQMIETPYHILGMNLWDKMYELPEFANIEEGLNVSPRSFSKYLAPYHILENNIAYNGYRWSMAHYLDPIAIQHFLITGKSDVNASPIYQNPGWPLAAGESALY